MPQGGKTTDLSFMARLITGVKYAITGQKPGQDIDAVPFNPGQPLQPVFQEPMQGRQWDYPVGYNMRYVPRQDEPISFAQLRALADNYDLLRLVIETVKDQVCMVGFKVKPKDSNKTEDARCKEVEEFLAFPDRQHTWQQWLRQVLEDMLVIDAATVYPRMTKGGKPYALELMDGALIKRVLDVSGRTPLPPEPAYQQYVKGVPAVDYSLDELIYFPRNSRTNRVYGFSHVEQIIITVNIAIRRQLHQLQYYTDGSTPDSIIGCPPEWNPDQIKQFQDFWDSILLGNTAARRGARFIPGGATIIDTKDKALKDEYDEWLARVVCFAFGREPTPFIKQMNRATAENATEAAKEQGNAPILAWIKNLIDLIIWKYFGYRDLECSYEQQKDVDPLIQAQVDQIYLQEYVVSPDEVRDRMGLEGPAPEKPAPPPIGGDDGDPGNSGNGNGPSGADTPAGDKAKTAGSNGSDTGADGKGKPGGSGAAGAVQKVSGADVERALKKKAIRPIDRNRPAVAKARKELKSTLVDFLKDRGKDAADQVGEAYDALKGALDQEGIVDRIMAALDFKQWAALIDPAAEVLEKVFADGAAEGFAQISFDASENITNLMNERALEYAESRGAELVGMRNIGSKADPEWIENPDARWAITDTTRDMLRSTVSDAIEEGWSTDRLKKEVRESTGFDESRAETIARTEVAFADSEGNMAAYRASGVVSGKEWIIGSEHDDDDDCDENADAGIIGLDDAFPDGSDTAPAHPRCVCDVLPVVMDEEDTGGHEAIVEN